MNRTVFFDNFFLIFRCIDFMLFVKFCDKCSIYVVETFWQLDSSELVTLLFFLNSSVLAAIQKGMQ